MQNFFNIAKGSNVSGQIGLKICLGIACSLRFLHTHTPSIVHGYLMDENVMFDKDGRVKIEYVGLSRL